MSVISGSESARETSTDASSSVGADQHIPVKNSFIHIEDRVEPSAPLRDRANSAPCIVIEDKAPIEAAPTIPDEETSSTPQPPIDDRVIEFRGDIFFTVFQSPICERPPAALPSSTTTLMVRNIPTRFTSVSFLHVLDNCGFRSAFDFFYLPMDFRTGKNMGYCFINFIHHNYTLMFSSLFHGRRLRMTTSVKVIEISASRRQGLLSNVALFHDSDLLGSMSLPQFKPLVLLNGALRPLSERTYAEVFAINGTSDEEYVGVA